PPFASSRKRSVVRVYRPFLLGAEQASRRRQSTSSSQPVRHLSLTAIASERRPSAEMVPGRRGACLAVRTSPAALHCLFFQAPSPKPWCTTESAPQAKAKLACFADSLPRSNDPSRAVFSARKVREELIDEILGRASGHRRQDTQGRGSWGRCGWTAPC